MSKLALTLLTCVLVSISESAKILVVVPTPSISHQVVFRPLIQELVKRGHVVTVFTTDPVYPKGQAPANLTEIDLHDFSYNMWRDAVLTSDNTRGSTDDLVNQIKTFYDIMSIIFLKQMEHPEVKKLISSDTQFDLLILEAWWRPCFLFSHIFKNASVILASSFGGIFYNYDVVGAPARPELFFFSPLRQKLSNLTLFEKLGELHNIYSYEYFVYQQSFEDDALVKKILGPDVPSLTELGNKVDMLFINAHPLWEMNRPVPPSVLFMGGIHQNAPKELPKTTTIEVCKDLRLAEGFNSIVDIHNDIAYPSSVLDKKS